MVGVSDDAEISVRCGEQADEAILRMVRVLVLVDVQKSPGVLVSRQNVGSFFEESNRFHEQIIEVQCVRFQQCFLIFRVNLGHASLHRRCTSAASFVSAHAFGLVPTDVCERSPGLQLLWGNMHVFQDILHDLLLIVRVVNHETLVPTDLLDVSS